MNIFVISQLEVFWQYLSYIQWKRGNLFYLYIAHTGSAPVHQFSTLRSFCDTQHLVQSWLHLNICLSLNTFFAIKPSHFRSDMFSSTLFQILSSWGINIILTIEKALKSVSFTKLTLNKQLFLTDCASYDYHLPSPNPERLNIYAIMKIILFKIQINIFFFYF